MYIHTYTYTLFGNIHRLVAVVAIQSPYTILSLAVERSTSLKGLASIGAWGNQLGNCHGDLVRWIGEPTIPNPASFDALLKIPKPLALYAPTQTVSQKVFLPHVRFNFLFDRIPDLFRELMLGGGDACKNMPTTFWSA